MTAESIAMAPDGHRVGATWMACCRAHQNHTPSLSRMRFSRGILRAPSEATAREIFEHLETPYTREMEARLRKTMDEQ
jgi:hypothetical protein